MDAEVVRALRTVIDPELGIDIVSLGLVYEAIRQGEVACVKMTMTSPACPLSEMMIHDAKAAVTALVPGVRQVEVELVFEPRWTPERMSDEARRQLGHL